MSLPKITAYIGETVSQDNKSEYSSIIKNVKKVKENEEPYIVFFTIDLPKENMYFKLDKKLNQDSVYEYYYFGNNSAAASQYYLTRETSSLKYLLTSTFGDLYQTLVKYGMENSELANLLKTIEEKDILCLGQKKGEGKINLDKFTIVMGKNIEKIEIDAKKNIVVDEKTINPEAFIRLFIEDSNKNNKFVLIVPKIILKNGEEIILSSHPDYLKLVKIINNLGTNNNKESEDNSKSNKVCYICKEEKKDVSSEYSKKFDRTGINKIFTTTTINASPYLKNCDYDYNYSICSECYKKLLAGEKVILKEFRSKIAGEDVFIIPEALLDNLNYNRLNILKNQTDLAFKSKDAKTWIDTIHLETGIDNIWQYSVNLIFYRTDGNSVTVLETIEDVPILRLEKVMNAMADYTELLEPYTDKISLGSIYRFVPVKTNKKGEQLDIVRVLSLYKAILSGEKLCSNILFNYAAEALEKGNKQLEKKKVDNYNNMNLTRYIGYEDFFIKRIVFGYIVLFKVCEELNILDKNVFKQNKEEGKALDVINTPSDKVNSSIMKIEEFLDNQGFNNDARALFYLGILVNRVALAQMKKEHKTKPILKKIQFQGMNEKDVFRLYQDTVEKLRQYDRMTLFSEAVMNRFHYFYGTLGKDRSLNDQANVFYIMAGYSYMVGNKSPDISSEEYTTLGELEEEDNEN